MNVKAHLAGKTGFCPECGVRMQIPYEDTRVSSKALRDAGSVPKPETAPTTAETPQDAVGKEDAALLQPTESHEPTTPRAPSAANSLLADKTLIWYLQIPGGTQYGPVDSQVVAKWIEEKRIAPEMLVWREDWPQWQEARDVFPEIR